MAAPATGHATSWFCSQRDKVDAFAASTVVTQLSVPAARPRWATDHETQKILMLRRINGALQGLTIGQGRPFQAVWSWAML